MADQSKNTSQDFSNAASPSAEQVLVPIPTSPTGRDFCDFRGV
jgi:hypothetical protein